MANSRSCRKSGSHVVVFLFIFINFTTHLFATTQPWTWVDKDGNVRTQADLDRILQDHLMFRNSDGKQGKAADLSKAKLMNADLHGRDLRDVELWQADLTQADLTDAKLGPTLIHVYLTRAKLAWADFSGVDLTSARLDGADLQYAKFKDADLTYVKARGARLAHADFTKAILIWTNFQNADLMDTDFTDVDMKNIYLGGALFEPRKLPSSLGMASVQDLDQITYLVNPNSLSILRKQFEDQGFRNQERKLTYALKRTEAEHFRWECRFSKTNPVPWQDEYMDWVNSRSNAGRSFILSSCAAYAFNRVFFDLTCQYGMSPSRPLLLLVLMWLASAILYVGFIHNGGPSGLILIVKRERHGKSQVHEMRIKPRILSLHGGGRLLSRFVKAIPGFLRSQIYVLRAASLFSLMSAFNLGFREVNVGNWLRMISRKEYEIKSIGWARTASGCQSIISLYFFALWVLTYFGHPFSQ